MASYEQPGLKIGFLNAGADLRTSQYCFVTIDGNGVVQLAGAGVTPLGVLQNKPNTGEACEIMVNGVSNVKADDTGVTVGNLLQVHATAGTAMVLGADAESVGIALQTAAAGAIFAAIINCGGAGYKKA